MIVFSFVERDKYRNCFENYFVSKLHEENFNNVKGKTYFFRNFKRKFYKM